MAGIVLVAVFGGGVQICRSEPEVDVENAGEAWNGSATSRTGVAKSGAGLAPEFDGVGWYTTSANQSSSSRIPTPNPLLSS